MFLRCCKIKIYIVRTVRKFNPNDMLSEEKGDNDIT